MVTVIVLMLEMIAVNRILEPRHCQNACAFSQRWCRIDIEDDGLKDRVLSDACSGTPRHVLLKGGFRWRHDLLKGRCRLSRYEEEAGAGAADACDC